MTVRYPIEAFEDGHRVGIIEPTFGIQKGTDGAEKRRPIPPTRMTYGQTLTVKNVAAHLDSKTVCQIAVAKLLASWTMHRHNLEALLATGDLQSSSFRFDRIIFDIPRREEQEKPMPVVAIVEDAAASYDMPNLEATIDEQTIDAYGDGTVLRQVSTATVPISVHVLMAHHEERRAVRKQFELSLLAEPDDDQTGRRVIVPQYYDRTVRINLGTMQDIDSEDGTQANEFELVAKLEATVDVVQLVVHPARMSQPIVALTMGTALIDGT